jgi:hypothetical protein
MTDERVVPTSQVFSNCVKNNGEEEGKSSHELVQNICTKEVLRPLLRTNLPPDFIAVVGFQGIQVRAVLVKDFVAEMHSGATFSPLKIRSGRLAVLTFQVTE